MMTKMPPTQIVDLGLKATEDWLTKNNQVSSNVAVDFSRRFSDYLVNEFQLENLFNFLTVYLAARGAPLELPKDWVRKQLNRSMLASIADLPGHSSTLPSGRPNDDED